VKHPRKTIAWKCTSVAQTRLSIQSRPAPRADITGRFIDEPGNYSTVTLAIADRSLDVIDLEGSLRSAASISLPLPGGIGRWEGERTGPDHAVGDRDANGEQAMLIYDPNSSHCGSIEGLSECPRRPAAPQTRAAFSGRVYMSSAANCGPLEDGTFHHRNGTIPPRRHRQVFLYEVAPEAFCEAPRSGTSISSVSRSLPRKAQGLWRALDAVRHP